MYFVLLPFAANEAQLPAGTAVWSSDDLDFHDYVGSGTEILLLFVVVISLGWHMIRLVGVRSPVHAANGQTDSE